MSIQLDREEETEACQSHVVHDLLSNVRAKISGLCQQIGYEACNNMLPTADRVRNTNTSSLVLFFRTLTWHVQAVMVLIEHYNTLKAGEVWAEIRNALADEGVVPLNVCLCFCAVSLISRFVLFCFFVEL